MRNHTGIAWPKRRTDSIPTLIEPLDDPVHAIRIGKTMVLREHDEVRCRSSRCSCACFVKKVVAGLEDYVLRCSSGRGLRRTENDDLQLIATSLRIPCIERSGDRFVAHECRHNYRDSWFQMSRRFQSSCSIEYR